MPPIPANLPILTLMSDLGVSFPGFQGQVQVPEELAKALDNIFSAGDKAQLDRKEGEILAAIEDLNNADPQMVFKTLAAINNAIDLNATGLDAVNTNAKLYARTLRGVGISHEGHDYEISDRSNFLIFLSQLDQRSLDDRKKKLLNTVIVESFAQQNHRIQDKDSSKWQKQDFAFFKQAFQQLERLGFTKLENLSETAEQTNKPITEFKTLLDQIMDKIQPYKRDELEHRFEAYAILLEALTSC